MIDRFGTCASETAKLMLERIRTNAKSAGCLGQCSSRGFCVAARCQPPGVELVDTLTDFWKTLGQTGAGNQLSHLRP